MPNIIDRLNRAIDIEYDAKNQELKEISKLSLEERVLKGETIINVSASFIPLRSEGTTLHFNKVIVRCPDNMSKFRETTPVILSGHGCNFKLEIIQDNNTEMVLEDDYNLLSVPVTLNNRTGWQIDSAAVDIRGTVKKSTSILSYNQASFNQISGILSGKILPKFNEARVQKAKQIVQQTSLDSSQKEAFIKAFSSENYFLIQGPPGSGKTWLLAHLAHEFAKEGNKVLVTAFTHTAINNALQKTSTLTHYDHIVKVGKRAQMEGLNYDGSTAKNWADFSRSGYNNYSSGIIVGATCYAPHTKKLSFMDWDVVIIDEAGQLSIPLAVAAMVKGKKIILIGDHKQLPPIISGEQDDIEFTKSIFEHLFNFAPGQMLNVTYRMNAEINRFPSNQFYNGKLLPASKNADWVLEIPNKFEKYSEILDKNKPEVLYCHFHHSDHSRSDYEAELVAKFVNEYLNNGVNPSDIAIITPFRAQVRHIKKSLALIDGYNNFEDRLFVDTIERIQGQERDIIIYSLTTSDPVKAEHRADFFFNPNRFNVALTRAKKKRIVIANQDLFEYESKDPYLNSLIKNFKDFYEEAYVVQETVEAEDLY